MMQLPAPRIDVVDGIFVVRDDDIPGGTKRRVIGRFLGDAAEVIYASPAYGYAQVALAHICREQGRQASIFTARRKTLHPRTMEAQAAGAVIHQISPGYLSVVQSRARSWAAQHGGLLLPFGFDTDEFRDALTEVARGIGIKPTEVWCAAGSGTLCRALQQAWPDAPVHAVQVGKVPDIGRAILHVAPESFEQDAKEPPPFASTSNYDAKVWRFIRKHAAPGALFWNVAR